MWEFVCSKCSHCEPCTPKLYLYQRYLRPQASATGSETAINTVVLFLSLTQLLTFSFYFILFQFTNNTDPNFFQLPTLKFQTNPCNRKNSVNQVVSTPAELLPAAFKLAKEIVANSPDAVQSTKYGLMLSQLHNVADTVSVHAQSRWSRKAYAGENIKVGVSFIWFDLIFLLFVWFAVDLLCLILILIGWFLALSPGYWDDSLELSFPGRHEFVRVCRWAMNPPLCVNLVPSL